MIAGALVVLREVRREDVPLLHELGQDYEEWQDMSTGPYAPTALDEALRKYDAGESWRPTDAAVPFVIEAGGQLVGRVSLWGIDVHNRSGHLGVAVRREARGNGYGSDACRAVLGYAFTDRGLHRVQLETLATNEAALRAYAAAGFVEEGRLRQSAWVRGRFVDEVIMSVLRPDSG